MNLLLERTPSGTTCTIGDLYIDGDWFCFILEDLVREVEGQPVESWKVKGKTAIPAGTYKVQTTYSNRFKRDLPLLVGVPGFEGIRIHPGNTDADTEGCLLPGLALGLGGESVSRSRAAFDALYKKLDEAESASEEIEITITNAGQM
ncbi:MAG: DUF5675 family protein [bacterium]|jgi:hypothetical protein